MPMIKQMFSPEMKKVILGLLTSWQVIAVTVVLILYVFLVNYVGSLYHRRPLSLNLGKAKAKKKKKAAPVPAAEEITEEATDDDELGLEES
jgi:hypothetical protein